MRSFTGGALLILTLLSGCVLKMGKQAKTPDPTLLFWEKSAPGTYSSNCFEDLSGGRRDELTLDPDTLYWIQRYFLQTDCSDVDGAATEIRYQFNLQDQRLEKSDANWYRIEMSYVSGSIKLLTATAVTNANAGLLCEKANWTLNTEVGFENLTDCTLTLGISTHPTAGIKHYTILRFVDAATMTMTFGLEGLFNTVSSNLSLDRSLTVYTKQ